MTTGPRINALFLAEDESMLALDRKVLRPLGLIQTAFFASGAKALDYLRSGGAHGLVPDAARAAHGAASTVQSGAVCRVDMVICHERLADMTGLQFLGYLRALPHTPGGWADIPAVLIVSNGESPTAYAARLSRSCAVLARPYSAHAASEALTRARAPEARTVPMVLPSSFADTFASISSPPHDAASRAEVAISRAREGKRVERKPLLQRGERATPPGEIALREGIASLRHGDTDTAEKFLRGAYGADPLRPETSLALSRLAALRHNEADALLWLCRAACLYLRLGNKPKADELFGRLPRGKAGQTPLLRLAGEALQSGETRTSSACFLEAHRLDPAQGLHALVSRTCMFTPAPEEHIRELVRAFASSGHGATASKLHMRLLQGSREERREQEESFLSRFPLLQDIVTVAAHTIKAWRYAA